MSTRSLENLIIWQAARRMAADVYRQTGSLRFHDRHLRGELRSTARAVMATIASGYAADSPARLSRGFDRAAEAVTNLSSLLHLTVDLDLVEPPAAAGLLARSLELSRLIRGWQRAIREHVVEQESAKREARGEGNGDD